MLSKCESCVRKKSCIDSANYKYAKNCMRYKENAPDAATSKGEKIFQHSYNNTKGAKCQALLN